METSVTLTMWDPTRISVLGQFRSVTVPMTFTQLPRTSSESVSLLSEVFPRKKGKRLLIAFLSDSLFLPPPFFSSSSLSLSLWSLSSCCLSPVSGFDDGPTEASSDLYNFLSSNNQSSTHFLIGSNVLDYSDAIQQAAEGGNQQFAVHT